MGAAMSDHRDMPIVEWLKDGNHRPQPTVDVDYWLPITKVNVTGSVVTATRKSDQSTTRKPTPAVVSVVTRPDYACDRFRLKMPADAWAQHKAKIEFLTDARLASVEATNTSGRAAALKGILSFTALGAGFGAAGGPLGALIGAAAGLAAAGVTLAAFQGLDYASPQDAIDAYYQALDILPGYAHEHVDDASQLADLRIAEAKGRLGFAAAAMDGTAALEPIARRLRLIRTELTLSEAAYQKWLDSDLMTTTVSYDEDIAIADLPGPDDVQKWYKTPHPERSPEIFRNVCSELGIAIGCEPEPSAKEKVDLKGQKPSASDDGQVRYRPLRPAVLRVYAVTKAGVLRLHSTQRVLVAAPGNEKAVPLLIGKADRSLTVSFDAAGALTSISSDVTGPAMEAASALGALPAALKDAFNAGTELGKPFSAAGRAEALKAQSDEAKARADLAALSETDPNKKLREEVATAELDARLKIANQVANGGASTAVVVMGGASD
jgi:hypothetical protein